MSGQIASWDAATHRSRDLPHWLGWWALVAGSGQVLARAVWTSDLAFVPFASFWVWTGVLCVMLFAGRFDRAPDVHLG